MLPVLTGDGDYSRDVSGNDNEERQNEHADETERRVQLLLPWLCVESECHALVEVFVEWPFLHVEDHQLQTKIILRNCSESSLLFRKGGVRFQVLTAAVTVLWVVASCGLVQVMR